MPRSKIILLLIIVLLFNLTGCVLEGEGDLEVFSEVEMEEVVVNWAVNLFREGFVAEENYLISPLSVLMALSMTANGAEQATLAQMEKVWGVSIEKLNQHLLEQAEILKDDDLHIANSLWFNSNQALEIMPQFLKLNETYYQAEVYQEKFNDLTTAQINNWVAQHTAGMIEKIIEEIQPDSVLYLLNALAFDAQWEETYAEEQVFDDFFTNYQKQKKPIKLMRSEESIYLSDEKAQGFIKPYAGGKFSFVGILPQDFMQYVQEMDGETLLAFLDSAEKAKVDAYLPKFSYDYGVKMNELLIGLGIVDAFDPQRADFRRLAKIKGENIYIDEVLHKTFIEVDEKGTKAAAVTSVGIVCTSASIAEVRYEVKLERPFLYLIINHETGCPIFMGTVVDVEA